jgi:hypothetical protein
MNNSIETIHVQAGIPIPSLNRKSKTRDLILETMKRIVRGESFFIPFSKYNYNSVNVARSLAVRLTGNCYTCRAVTENGERGTRIWRIA